MRSTGLTFPRGSPAGQSRGSQERLPTGRTALETTPAGKKCAQGSLHLQARGARCQALTRPFPSWNCISAGGGSARRAVPAPQHGGAGWAAAGPGCPRLSPRTPGPRTRSHRRGRGGTERAGSDLTWGCTSPRPRAAPRSPSTVVPAPRRPKPLTPLPLPCPRPRARCHRAAAAWRHGSHGRTPGR